jgi:Cd2+/Zn2+-exporting ATPase
VVTIQEISMTTCSRAQKKEITTTGCGCSSQANIPDSGNAMASPAAPAGATLVSIPTMDCASEENDIRRALADISGIQSLNFQLSARTLALLATPEAVDSAVKAIRQAGYAPAVIQAGADSPLPHNSQREIQRAVAA